MGLNIFEYHEPLEEINDNDNNIVIEDFDFEMGD